MWSHSTQITADFISCRFTLLRKREETHTHADTEREIRDFSVTLRGNVIDTICPHINLYFPKACRLSPASNLAERTAVPRRYYSSFQEAGQRVRRIFRRMNDCVHASLHICPVHVCFCDKSMHSYLTCVFTPQSLIIRVGN